MQYAKGILFDFDGVIGDTMEDNYKAWIYALGQHGCTFSKKEYFLLEGKRVAKIAESVLQKFGKDPALGAEVAKLKDDYYNKNNNFRFADGVEELVDMLITNQVPFGLVSGGARARLLSPSTTPLLSKFTALVTADDCKIGKPDAEPYLIGAKKLNLPVHECFVVENAPMGIAAAKAAEMFCVGLCTTLSEEFLDKADVHFSTFRDFATSLKISSKQVSLS